jgi:hypothetical protein
MSAEQQVDYSVLEREMEAPLQDGGGLFCGQNSEGFAINGVTYQWVKGSKVTWGYDFSRAGTLSYDDMVSATKEFLKEISECCDLFFEHIKNAAIANIKIISVRLDGSSGVLADMEIPPPQSRADSTQLRGRVDDSENWVLADNPPSNTIDFYRTMLHEFEHACGLGHKPPSIKKPALIAPIYSPTMRHLQQADIDELVRRYGVNQSPVIPPVSGRLPVNYKAVHEIEQSGKKWKGTVSGVLLPVD